MKRPFRSILTTAAIGAGALAAYATLVEPRWLQLTRPTINLRRLPRPLEGLRIGLLTDMHAGAGTPFSVIHRACRMIMAERPDLIALTGDFAADDAPNFRRVLAVLSGLRAPLGVYAVPGNHDYLVGIDKWHREVRDAGIEDLTNRAVTLDRFGARLCIAGVDDYSNGQPTLAHLPPADARDLTILLAHDPDQAERSRREEDQIDLILSGHTHGGQVRLPFVGALTNPADNDELYEQGLRRRPWTQVYTSRGIGTVHLPVRFLCRPEVAALELTARPRESL
jgi:predicted MPP superfamily phosphohydrolase